MIIDVRNSEAEAAQFIFSISKNAVSQYLPWYVDALTAVFRCTYLGVSLTIQRYDLGKG